MNASKLNTVIFAATIIVLTTINYVSTLFISEAVYAWMYGCMIVVGVVYTMVYTRLAGRKSRASWLYLV